MSVIGFTQEGRGSAGRIRTLSNAQETRGFWGLILRRKMVRSLGDRNPSTESTLGYKVQIFDRDRKSEGESAIRQGNSNALKRDNLACTYETPIKGHRQCDCRDCGMKKVLDHLVKSLPPT